MLEYTNEDGILRGATILIFKDDKHPDGNPLALVMLEQELTPQFNEDNHTLEVLSTIYKTFWVSSKRLYTPVNSCITSTMYTVHDEEDGRLVMARWIIYLTEAIGKKIYGDVNKANEFTETIFPDTCRLIPGAKNTKIQNEKFTVTFKWIDPYIGYNLLIDSSIDYSGNDRSRMTNTIRLENHHDNYKLANYIPPTSPYALYYDFDKTKDILMGKRVFMYYIKDKLNKEENEGE